MSILTMRTNETIRSMPRRSNDDARWRAVERRDREADGTFVYSVRTTGVYCRPSCAARLARRENVAFHATCADAERAGFRPCKRCRPNEASLAERQAAAVAKACRLIEEAEELPSLDALARAAGLSRFHFHRVFKAVTGVTPKAYAAAHRGKRVRAELDANRHRHRGDLRRRLQFERPVLRRLVGPARHDADGVSRRRPRQRHPLRGRRVLARRDPGGGDRQGRLRDPVRRRSRRAGARPRRTAFRRRSSSAATRRSSNSWPRWSASSKRRRKGSTCRSTFAAPPSSSGSGRRCAPSRRAATASYAEIAARIGAPKSVRAVAQACAANALAVAIPCHRVVRTDGSAVGLSLGRRAQARAAGAGAGGMTARHGLARARAASRRGARR